MNLTKIFSELTTYLDKLDEGREKILPISRSMIRDCSNAIKHIHRKEFNLYDDKITAIKQTHSKLKEMVNLEPSSFTKYLKTPEQEYAEAISFYAIINKQELPTPGDLNIDPLNYAFGLADVIGELRRYALDNIRNSQLSDLNQILEDMDEIYTNLFSLDYPSGITQDLRPKTDRARSLIEKTRGDISISLQMNDLKRCIEKKDSQE
ncbi:MAG: translin family protein [Promethearchaeota archaeon]|nr:MAG: translin family protein [Candidatus Lokiarchaeota archaeon]